jgi:hypothetical protein
LSLLGLALGEQALEGLDRRGAVAGRAGVAADHGADAPAKPIR